MIATTSFMAVSLPVRGSARVPSPGGSCTRTVRREGLSRASFVCRECELDRRLAAGARLPVLRVVRFFRSGCRHVVRQPSEPCHLSLTSDPSGRNVAPVGSASRVRQLLVSDGARSYGGQRSRSLGSIRADDVRHRRAGAGRRTGGRRAAGAEERPHRARPPGPPAGLPGPGGTPGSRRSSGRGRRSRCGTPAAPSTGARSRTTTAPPPGRARPRSPTGCAAAARGGAGEAGLDLLVHVAVEARGVREVGLEEDVVDRDVAEQLRGRHRLEPVAWCTPAGRSTPTAAAPTRSCGRAGPRGSCGRRPRARTGTQPMPLSTDTNFRSGKRGSTPLVMRSAHCRPFFRNSSTDVYAYVAAVPCAAMRSGAERRVRCRRCRCGSGSAARASWATAHSGSQCGSPRYGRPKRCGSPVKRIAAVPGVDAALDLRRPRVDVPERRAP